MTVLAIVWAADVGAYTFGRWLGRIKLAPAVSPGKTWEGVSGGLLVAAAAAWIAAILIGLPAGALLALGVVTALVSVLGDLAVSVFKRNVGLKDTGTLLPGHGGVMDRIDSLTAAIPVFVLGLMLAASWADAGTARRRRGLYHRRGRALGSAVALARRVERAACRAPLTG